MNILIMGPAGAGKGTQSNLIVENYPVTHISTGDMFRQAIAEKTELGLKAAEYMNQGKLVPDDITIHMTKERLSKDDCAEGYLLDGFPRTLAQALAFEEITQDRPIDVVINLVLTVDDLAPRIVNRRVCKNCGAIYNVVSLPPKEEGICDVCGSALVHRTDDTMESLLVRMQEYESYTKPALEHFREEGLVVDINANQEIEKVWLDIDEALRRFDGKH